MNCCLPLCEQYAAMAKSFYFQYHQHQENAKSGAPSASIAMEQAAICAVIFQALAVESYVNLFGSVVLGDDVFRCRYESETDKKHRASTIDKIKNICNVELRNPYPTSGEDFGILKGLLDKRNKLVHPKSKPHAIENRPYNYKKPEDLYSDYVQAFNEEIGFIYNNLEVEMLVYDELKKNLARCNKGVEVIGLLRDNLEKKLEKLLRTL
ncbi:hypothetical protein SAMN05216343_10141 [Oscillibacter sp. PC13]|uniref:hypothetical protein n=1 Tax=Oscillibacter sp. PC13 TaxID=1855299 RepID=UPI0008E4B9BE|nr:hypothetical protein [Oscillibacter sp. PC13]SFO93461.1 hypothetical protein SAMN05216343_10141 [Oscillibacter sp. PC13]